MKTKLSMMIFKGIFIFLNIFLVQSGVTPESQEPLFDITDLKFLKNFVRENYNISESDYKLLDKSTLHEKNSKAKDVFLKTKLMIKKLSTMWLDSKQSRWKNYILKNFKPIKSNVGDLFYLSGRLKSVSKEVNYNIKKFNHLHSSPINGWNAKYCLHAWALNHYSMPDSFQNKVGNSNYHITNLDNICQLFLELTSLLAEGEIKENDGHEYCQRGFSYHQELFNLYKQVIIRGFIELSLQYFSTLGQVVCQFQKGSENLINDYVRRKENFMASLKRIMDSTEAALNNTTYYTYSCRSQWKKKNKLDIELEGMIQTRIIAEIDMSTTKSCTHNCDLNSIINTLNRTKCDEYLDCQFKSNHYGINRVKNSSRRYSHFDSFNKEDAYGDKVTRYGNSHRGPYKSGQYSKLLCKYSWGQITYCDYCICTCAMKQRRSPYSVTALSFRDQVSDIHNNKVVVGFEFVKKDYMIHIQILEGQVLPQGKIGQNSWKPLEQFDYDETIEKYYVVNDDDSKVSLELGVDYARPEVMNLNDVMAPEKHVITGVRFRIAGDSLNSSKLKKGPIELQIRVTPIDFVRGQLININQSRWMSPKEKVLENELILENLDNPLYESLDIEPTITSNKFLKFRASDLKKDAGQSTVPFFDGREITFSDRCLLGGIGLIHRGLLGSGGHLTIKIFDFDMSSYFNKID